MPSSSLKPTPLLRSSIPHQLLSPPLPHHQNVQYFEISTLPLPYFDFEVLTPTLLRLFLTGNRYQSSTPANTLCQVILRSRLGSSSIWRSYRGVDVSTTSSKRSEEDGDEALKCDGIEKIPTYLRIKIDILKEEGKHRMLEITNLGFIERGNLIDRLVKTVEKDNKNLLKLKSCIDRLEGLANKVMPWYLCRMEGWFAADSYTISLKCRDEESMTTSIPKRSPPMKRVSFFLCFLSSSVMFQPFSPEDVKMMKGMEAMSKAWNFELEMSLEFFIFRQ